MIFFNDGLLGQSFCTTQDSDLKPCTFNCNARVWWCRKLRKDESGKTRVAPRNCGMCTLSSPDWLIKKQTSSRKTGVFLSRKSLANSTMTGSSVSSSRTWRVWKSKRALLSIILLKQGSGAQVAECASTQTSHLCPQYGSHMSVKSDGFSMAGNTDVFPLCAFTPKTKSTHTADTYCHPGMVASAAGNKNKSPTPLDLFDVVLQSTQGHCKTKPNSSSIILPHYFPHH